MTAASQCTRCKTPFIFYDGYYDSLYHKGDWLCLNCFRTIVKVEKISKMLHEPFKTPAEISPCDYRGDLRLLQGGGKYETSDPVTVFKPQEK